MCIVASIVSLITGMSFMGVFHWSRLVGNGEFFEAGSNIYRVGHIFLTCRSESAKNQAFSIFHRLLFKTMAPPTWKRTITSSLVLS